MNVIVDQADDSAATAKARQANLLMSKRKSEHERQNELVEKHEHFNKFAEIELDKLTTLLKKLSEQNHVAKELWSQRKA